MIVLLIPAKFSFGQRSEKISLRSRLLEIGDDLDVQSNFAYSVELET